MPKLIAYYVGCVFSVGILYLLCRWMVKFWVACRMTLVEPTQADYFLVFGQDGSETIVKKATMVIDGSVRTVFEFRLYRYYFDDARDTFKPIETTFVRMKNSELLE